MIDSTDDSNRVFVYPTDTVWGMGGNIYSSSCSDLIYKIKEIDQKRPFSIMFSSFSQIEDFFDFPFVFNCNALRNLFKLEVTIAVPIDYLKVSIPEWIIQGSHLIAFRWLESRPVSTIIDRVGFPITSTSFNISKQDPIDNERDAKNLFDLKQKTIGNKMEFIEGKNCLLSGNASSIIVIDKNVQKISFLRRGKYAKEIEMFSDLFEK